MDLPVISFKSDTAERKRFFKAASFAHPAKMVLGLQIYLIEHYTKPGDTILDPMAGSGTSLIGCTLGRNMVLVELEKKFVKMQQDNWEKIKSLGPMLGFTMGQATILQGDARNLDGLLADNIVFSPPYAEGGGHGGEPTKCALEKRQSSMGQGTENLYGITKGNIGNLPYGEISAVISSPPYAEAQEGGGIAKKGYQGPKHGPTDLIGKRSYMPSQIGKTEGQIGNLPYGKADAVITSPPFADISAHSRKGSQTAQEHGLISDVYGKKPHYDGKWKPDDVAKRAKNRNIGHINILKNDGTVNLDTYLQAMLQVYRQCHRVLKKSGLLVLVTKNFIRDKKIIRLDLDTIKLCEQAGFTLKERLQRKLTQQSFWRTIYHKKFPDVEKIEYEDVLIFQMALFDNSGGK